MKINAAAEKIIRRLEEAGYESWLVGGCVRDLVMRKTPSDWDIASAAPPESVRKVFEGIPVIPTGLKHGTVTVVMDGQRIEVTTFRKDGDYSDGRRPESVQFVNDLQVDLSRRDFTINAIAYAPGRGIADPFNGKADIARKRLRTVGNPDRRLGEDGLRIMRALRFSAILDFEIDRMLSSALHRNKALLRRIAMERISAELMKMLPGKRIFEILTEFPDVFEVFMPEITPCVGFDQRNPHHALDVWGHIASAVEAAPTDGFLRLALLFHDLGKPDVFSVGDDGVGHFYRHEQWSERIARKRLNALKFDKKTIQGVCELIHWHDSVIDKRHITRWLGRLGETRLRQLLEIKLSDALAHTETFREKRMVEIARIRRALDQAIADAHCVRLADLAIKGGDLMKAGVPEGHMIGKILKALLQEVIDDRISNEREALMEAGMAFFRALEKGDREG